MDHLYLLIPDPIPPKEVAAEVCANLRLPALERLLGWGRADVPAVDNLEDWLCDAFAAEGVAPVRAAVDGVATNQGYWLCADPVHLRLQHSQVLLLPEPGLVQEEADALCASLNEHFADARLAFRAPLSHRWYLNLAQPLQGTVPPLSRTVWQDVKHLHPQGVDAMRWQRIATEAQMLLHAHPVNQAREARGALPVNGLWLWGGGRATALRQAFDAVGGDSMQVHAFARAAGVAQAEALARLVGEQGRGLWASTATGEAQRRGDYHAWRAAILRLEQECAAPLLRALRAGHVRRLTVEVLQEEGARRFELTRLDAWKLWRRVPSLAWYAV